VDRPWKAHERQVAKALGTRRNPNTGERRSDITTDRFSVEHKLRKRLPDWFHAAVEQSVAASAQEVTANGEPKLPIVIFTESRQGVKARRYVVLRFEDFLRVL
jgi:hypothetical protein